VDEKTPVLIPVGHSLGPEHLSDPLVYVLRVGWGRVELTEEEFTVWLRAHGVIPPESPAAQAVAERRLITEVGPLSAARSDVAASLVDHARDPDAAIETLLSRGLLRQVRPGSEDLLAFARDHRVLPLAQGLGNSTENPELYRVGAGPVTLATLGLGGYLLWARGGLDGSLWESCEALSAIVEQTGEARSDPADLLRSFFEALPGLLASGSLCIDVVPREGSET
jgi:hypothetical protein